MITIVRHANDRCNQEHLIAQLKSGGSAMRMPVDMLVSNGAYMVMAALAWNLKAWYALSLPVSGRGKDEHKRQKQQVLGMEFKKFRNLFIMLPCQIVKTGRRLIYRLLGWNTHVKHSLSCNRQFPLPVALLKTAPKMSGYGRPDSYQLLKE